MEDLTDIIKVEITLRVPDKSAFSIDSFEDDYEIQELFEDLYDAEVKSIRIID